MPALNKQKVLELTNCQWIDDRFNCCLVGEPGTGKTHCSIALGLTAHNLQEHEWWFADLARHLQLPQPTLYSWLRRGWVQGRQLPIAGGRWILWADHDELERLRRLHRCPKTWNNQPQAAALANPKTAT